MLRPQQAQAAQEFFPDSPQTFDSPAPYVEAESEVTTSFWESVSNVFYPPISPDTSMNTDANVISFLALIRRIEPSQNDPYTSLVGGGNFSGFTDHPANLGWKGIRVDGRKTTAAGAYQITLTTWNEIRSKGLDVPDFSPASQDAAALWILQYKRPGAYQLIAAGEFHAAMVRLRSEWQAFDLILKGTYYVSEAEAANIYQQNGGMIA